MKICIASSAGGHLSESLKLLPILKGHNVFFFTFHSKHIGNSILGHKVYYTVDPKRNIIKFFNVFSDSFKVFGRENPDLIISTGANVAVPISLIGKCNGKKLIHIECGAQVNTPSLTGRVLYPFADLFIVRWRALLQKYGKKAIYGGLSI
ncbi:hypothetical protein COS75_01515 [Candidatus Pacearchaeota archaeon CG06_land_8_20_14_3_00_35_12]|nr:MAG: hypothetical protein COS75_01515 [Candidatus Pacearchaeota archaeon CG06_land_8_20_14_3_00_35_12]